MSETQERKDCVECKRLLRINADLLAACETTEAGIRGQLRHIQQWERSILEKYANQLREVIAKAKGEA